MPAIHRPRTFPKHKETVHVTNTDLLHFNVVIWIRFSRPFDEVFQSFRSHYQIGSLLQMSCEVRTVGLMFCQPSLHTVARAYPNAVFLHEVLGNKLIYCRLVSLQIHITRQQTRAESPRSQIRCLHLTFDSISPK